MTTLDLLYLTLSAGFIALIIMMNIILFNIWKLVQALRNNIERCDAVTESMIMTPKKIRLLFLKAIKNALQRIKK